MRLRNYVVVAFLTLLSLIVCGLFFFTHYFKKIEKRNLPTLLIEQPAKHQLINPYSSFKVNNAVLGAFHFHTKLPLGETFDPQSYTDIFNQRGLDFINISDYNQVTNTSSFNPLYLPTYEHGVSLWPYSKHHFTVIHPDNSEPLPIYYPLWQSVEQIQADIHRLASHSKFLVLNHPKHANRYSPDDFSNLNGLNAIEVLTPYGESTDYWDKLLSNGHLLWGFSAPDVHDPYKRPKIAHYMVIFPDQHTPEGLLEALYLGKFYSVWDFVWSYPIFLLEVKETSEALEFVFSGMFHELKWIGQDGQIIKSDSFKNRTSIVKSDIQTYTRLEGRNQNFYLVLNPIMWADKVKSFRGRWEN